MLSAVGVVPVPTHRIAVNLTVNGQATPVNPAAKLRLQGLRNINDAGGPVSGGWFTVPVRSVADDKYVALLTIPHPQSGKAFHVISGVPGEITSDPALRTRLFPAMSEILWPITLVYPRDFVCRCFVRVLGADGQPISGGRLRAGGHLLETGAAAGVPAAYAQYHRGVLPPGEYPLRFEHPTFQLPPSTPPLVLTSTLQVIQIHSHAGTVQPFAIRGQSFLAETGRRLVFESNAPQGSSAEVSWLTANDSVLRSEGDGRYLAVSAGSAEISAIYQGSRASAAVQVRPNASVPVLTLPPATSIIVEPESRTKIAEGIVAVAVKEGVTADESRRLFEAFGLSLLGSVPGYADQLRYDTRRWTLRDLLTKLNADVRVDFACPEAMLSESASGSGLPGGFQYETDAWHLMHMEGYAALGVLRHLPRSPTTIGFVESGLAWRNGKFHPDLDGRVDVASSTYFHGLSVLLPAGVSQNLAFNRVAHGTQVAGAACAAWSNEFAAGVDPAAGIAVFKCPEIASLFPGTYFGGAVTAAAARITPRFRILNITMIMEGLGYWWTFQNKAAAKAVQAFAKKGGLVVIAAGNQDSPVKNIAIAAVKLALDKAYHDHVIVVTGTNYHNPGTGVVSERLAEAVVEEGSTVSEGPNYDTPDTNLIDLAAAASAVLTSHANGPLPTFGTVKANGTSVAAPLVSGAASLVWSILPNATAPEIKQILMSTADRFAMVDVVPPPHPAPPLYADKKRKMGVGRVNVWQAVLFALNARERLANSSVRYVGVRVATQEQQLQVYLEYAGSPAVQITASSLPTWPFRFFASRVTVSNRSPETYPIAIRAERKGPGNTTTIVFRRKLYLDAGAVEKLKPRYVVSCRAFLKGGVALAPLEAPALPSNTARLTIRNTGTRPQHDFELLDPKSRHPHDASIEPWMKLDAGDSYALVPTAPPGVTIKFMDLAGNVITAQDPEKRPYVVVPFDNKPYAFAVEATFGPSAADEATIVVQAVSLNNDLVTAQTSVALKRTGEATELGCAPGWVFQQRRQVPATSAQVTSAIVPNTWKCSHTVGNAQGGVMPITVEFESPPREVPGATGVCTLRVGSKPYPHRGRIELPALLWTCEQPNASGLIADGDLVRAVFRTIVFNSSRFRIALREFESHDSLSSTHLPAAPTKILFEHPSGTPVTEIGLLPNVGVRAAVTCYYKKSALGLPQGTTATRRLRLLIQDPVRRPPATSPKYPSPVLELSAIMRLL